jgi:NADH-quinone oxidoreductase subunit C
VTDQTPPEDARVEDDAAAEGPERLFGCLVEERLGQRIAFPLPDQYLPLMKDLVDDGFEMCTDLCAVDYLTHPGRQLPDGVTAERFEVVVNLIDLRQARRLRVRVQVSGEDPVVPSLFELWPGTEAMEREAFDMFGIHFDGHPDLTRILMPEDWIGHPLRKDYAEGRIPVQFKGADHR